MKEDCEGLKKYGEGIVSENNFLRKELALKNQVILKSDQVGVSANFLKLANETLAEKNTILTEKNTFLMQKIKELSDNVDRDRMTSLKPNQTTLDVANQLREEKERQREGEIKIL